MKEENRGFLNTDSSTPQSPANSIPTHSWGQKHGHWMEKAIDGSLLFHLRCSLKSRRSKSLLAELHGVHREITILFQKYPVSL